MRPHEAVYAKHSRRFFALFGVYLRYYFSRNFRGVRVAGGENAKIGLDTPLVIYSNHPSWWDPILYFVVGRRYFREWRGFGPMEKEALEKYAFMKRLGIFPIEKTKRRGARDFLAISLGLLEKPGTCLWITPEGDFTDVRKRPVALAPGLAHLAKRSRNTLFLPVAVELTFWNEKRPEALVQIGDPVMTPAEPEGDVEAWSKRLTDALETTMDQLGELSIARDPDAFELVVGGRTGVGFFYDGWRRLKAWVRGRRFSAAHEDRNH